MKACFKILPAALLALLCLGFLAACSSGAGPGKAPEKLETLDMPALEKHFASNKGKVTLVMFWATWCPACKTEIPVLEQLRAKYPKEKLDVMAISVDDTEQVMGEFLMTRPTTLDVYLSKAEVGSEFGVKSIPALYILDKNGQVAFNSAGVYPFEMLDSVISQLVKD
ncbi:MAG: TlpA disulfide reductase family protein [Humidesulfovibrio sp.]|jgi:thiol-disulfide isomerase/thioredoxin|uniref:TlpA family protein disulfide reductase n=1 Tax=Humidesulfovibrio sp. TaxID=2910988 RepID=UPI002733DAEF|nr:TlpA disulfide reductase family protein [Humidesulfovibrio sp.]MDP2846874.1 TlpA disulfide reductase family protein [Humidesulfovibrio sp.]